MLKVLIRSLLSACQGRFATWIRLEDKLLRLMTEYASYPLHQPTGSWEGLHTRVRNRLARGGVQFWQANSARSSWRGSTNGDLCAAAKEGLQAVRSVRRLLVEERRIAVTRSYRELSRSQDHVPRAHKTGVCSGMQDEFKCLVRDEERFGQIYKRTTGGVRFEGRGVEWMRRNRKIGVRNERPRRTELTLKSGDIMVVEAI